MSRPTPEELAQQLVSAASSLAQRADVAEVPDPRRLLYALATTTSAMASTTGLIGGPARPETAAAIEALHQAERALHTLQKVLP
ncbi:hypothetical protein [Streptomyces sp. NBC_00212]|uniref:hypothetical protein n=1 Tax=Streptomyces sp. NBC_00212 TaxID=2975684 RepID=UPI002F90DCE2